MAPFKVDVTFKGTFAFVSDGNLALSIASCYAWQPGPRSLNKISQTLTDMMLNLQKGETVQQFDHNVFTNTQETGGKI